MALVHRDFFIAPAATAESNTRVILGLTANYQAALDLVGQDPGLRQQIDMLRRDFSLAVPAGDRDSSWSWVDMFRGKQGAVLAIAYLCAIVVTFGLALIVLAIHVVSVSNRQNNRGNNPRSAADSAWEIRRVQVSQFWEREEHIEQLSPGTKSTRTLRMRMGITEEQSRELTTNLCLPQISSLGPEWTRKLGSTTRLEQSREVERSTELHNDRTGYYRRLAIWHLVDIVQVEALTARSGRLGWAPRTVVRYYHSDRVPTSFVDIAKADL